MGDHTTEELIVVVGGREYSTFVHKFAVPDKYQRERIALLVVAVIMFTNRNGEYAAAENPSSALSLVNLMPDAVV